MKIIKVSSGLPEKKDLLLRQTKNFSGVWGDCKFVVNKNIDKCDWWFVLHGSGLVKPESCLCDVNHIIYVSMEPDEKMSKVSSKFLNQFSLRFYLIPLKFYLQVMKANYLMLI